MKNPVKTALRGVAHEYLKRVCQLEYKRPMFGEPNERPVELAFVFRSLAQTYPKSVLDVGTGTTALPHLMANCGFKVTAIDNVRDYWPAGMVNRHYLVIDDNICESKLGGPFDLITCISVLEHIERFDEAIKNMFRLLAPGGHLILTVPYTESEYVRNVYELPGSSYGKNLPYITQSFCRQNIEKWLGIHGAELVEQEFWDFWEGQHWTVGKKSLPPKQVSARDKHQIGCFLLRRKQ